MKHIPEKQEKLLEIIILALLFASGAYHSVLYFGHQVVPNPDFPDFIQTGHDLLSFRLPVNFKRAPVVGLLQVSLGYLIGGVCPDLTAARLIDAVLHPLSIVLLYLLGKKIVPKAAVWIAIIASINPWLIKFLTESAAETILLFFVLLTYYFIFRRSAWSYLFASITTMVRYEGAALILAAFIIDIIHYKTTRRRIKALICAAVASIPLALWLLCIILSWNSQEQTHYLKELGSMSGGKIVLATYIRVLWETTFWPLFMPLPDASESLAAVIFATSKIVATAAFVFGSFYGFYKRNWNIPAMLIFIVPYIFVHAVHSFVFHRVCTTVHWIALLICMFGLENLRQIFVRKLRITETLLVPLRISIIIIAGLWAGSLLQLTASMERISEKSVHFAEVTIGFVLAVMIAQIIIKNTAALTRRFAVAAVMCLMIASNQLILARVMGNGQRDIEFKFLTDWYLSNAKPDEKLVCSMSHLLRVLAQKYKNNFLSPCDIAGESPAEFTANCARENITYVVWDSRLGNNPASRYYKLWKLGNIAMLARPHDVGPYKFITRLGGNDRYVNVFRLQNQPEINSE
ncbi:MAG: hypothetical protein ABIG61_01280 [Planctomycetota bacterium]